MNIELIRTSKSKESIDGILLVNGTKICETAENAITALPAGNYRIARHFCKQYNRFVPLIVENQASGSRAEEDAKCKVLSLMLLHIALRAASEGWSPTTLACHIAVRCFAQAMASTTAPMVSSSSAPSSSRAA